MYQMLTGELPYNTPAPSDIEKLMRGELITAPRVRNSKIPKTINDIIMRALAPDLTQRYQRAADLLEDLLPARAPAGRRAKAKRTAVGLDLVDANVADIHSRLKARETPQARFCWQCRKPLHARSDRCPFCNEAQ